VIVLNGEDVDFEVMKSHMLERRAAAKLARKNKKKSAEKPEGK